MINATVSRPDQIFHPSNPLRTESDIILSFMIERFNKIIFDKAQRFHTKGFTPTEQTYRFRYTIPTPMFNQNRTDYMEAINNQFVEQLEQAGWKLEYCRIEQTECWCVVLEVRMKE